MLHYFTDPVLRAPTLGSMFMCMAASLMGVVLFLKKRSLLGESLSHAAYPGVILGIALFAALGVESEKWELLFPLIGAFVFSALGLKMIDWLQKKERVSPDAALCFTLASLFGVGILATSWLQSAYPSFVKQAEMYLYGQSATMTDLHIGIYGILTLSMSLFLVLTYRRLQALLFDELFCKTSGLISKAMSGSIFFLLLLSIIIGSRSVGVVLMSGMLIAPAVTARQFTNRLSSIFWIAGLLGALCGALGTYISVEGSSFYSAQKLSLPTGPIIVLISSSFALLSLLFAPKRGLAARLLRIFSFRLRCMEENVLKSMWKKGESSFSSLREVHHLHFIFFALLLLRMRRHGWILFNRSIVRLSADGLKRAIRIVRLHRLWEVYLAELGWPEDKVHQSAEEMEHVLTSELGDKLTVQLSNPALDPHRQPIPGEIE